MNYYEILYIVNPNFEKKKIDETMKKIEARLKKTKSKVINHIIWGKKKLAYQIQDHKYGTYILAHYNGGDKNALNEFNSWLKLSDLVIRHMIIRLVNEPEVIEKIDDDSQSDAENQKDSENDNELKNIEGDINKEKSNEELKGVE